MGSGAMSAAAAPRGDGSIPIGRARMPDVLRVAALFGIVLVNVQFMAFPFLDDRPDYATASVADGVAEWLVNGLAYFKSFGLFSFMFGVGLGFLMASAARRDLRFGPLYRNRMIGLLLLGLAHGCLFFPGDILVVYAITGSILYTMRNWTVRRLVRWGVALVAAQSLLAAASLAIPADAVSGEGTADPLPALIAWEAAVLAEGSFAQVLPMRAVTFALALPYLLLWQGPAALGWFCLGLAAVKAAVIDAPDHALWRCARRYALVPGVGLSLLGAGMMQWGAAQPGEAVVYLAAPLASLGYLGVIAALARPEVGTGSMGAAVLAAGGASLTVYLGQSILLSTLFGGYGGGLWGTMGAFAATLWAVAVTVVLIAAMALWRRVARHGPFEWLLRRVTYAGQRR